MARNLVAWQDQVKARIGAIAVREGLHIRFLAIVQGPLVFTFVIALHAGRKTDLDRLLSLGPTIAHSLGNRAVRISQTQEGSVAVEVPSPFPRTPTAEELAPRTTGHSVCLGLDSIRRPVNVDLWASPSVLFVGPTRSGKTEAARSALYGMAKSYGGLLRFYVIAPKRFRWEDFEGAAGCLGVITDTAKALEVATWAAGELLKGRVQTGAKVPPYLFLYDDLHALLGEEPKLAEPIARLASTGGEVSLWQFLITQDAGSKAATGGSQVEANVTARVLYKSATATHAARASGFGGSGLEDLTGYKGDALVKLPWGEYRAATGYTTERLGYNLPQATSNRYNRPTTATTATTGLATPPPTLDTRRPHRGEVPAPVAAVVPVVPVVAVAPQVPQGKEEAIAWVRANSPSGMFPVKKRPLTPPEASEVRKCHGVGVSLNSLCVAVYGFKDGETMAHIKAALLREDQAEAGSGEPGEDQAEAKTGTGKVLQFRKGA